MIEVVSPAAFRPYRARRGCATVVDMRTPRVHARPILIAALPLLLVAALAACGDDDAAESSDLAAFSLDERLLRMEIPVASWQGAEDVAEAHASAEAAANLVVGTEGPGYGDRDGDGVIEDEDVDEFGVLPGLDGTPPGLAELVVDNECVEADVLGGSWDDPAARWAELDAAIENWSPENDTISTLASQPMQIVGWATLAISTDVLDEARAFGSLAAANLETSLDAGDC